MPLNVTKKQKVKAPEKVGEDLRHEQMLVVLRQFRVVFKTVRQHYHEVKTSTHVSGAQLWALANIAQRQGCTVRELAQGLAIHTSTASNLLNKLAEFGLVVRRREADDRRVVTLYLTAEGEAVIKNAPQPLIGVLQHALTQLPAHELVRLGEGLGVLIGAMNVTDPTAGSTPISDI